MAHLTMSRQRAVDRIHLLWTTLYTQMVWHKESDAASCAGYDFRAIWALRLILPVVIYLSQRLRHACSGKSAFTSSQPGVVLAKSILVTLDNFVLIAGLKLTISFKSFPRQRLMVHDRLTMWNTGHQESGSILKRDTNFPNCEPNKLQK